MKTVILHGELGRRFGRYHRLAVKTTAEAVRALMANYSGFEEFLCKSHSRGVGYRVFHGKQSHGLREINYPAGLDTIRIAPAIMGSKGWLDIVIGAALVSAAIFLAPTGLGFPLGALGASMIIGGVSGLLSKPPSPLDLNGPQAQASSFIFSGPSNSTAQGTAVPIGYGRMIIGSTVVSAGIETFDQA